MWSDQGNYAEAWRKWLTRDTKTSAGIREAKRNSQTQSQPGAHHPARKSSVMRGELIGTHTPVSSPIVILSDEEVDKEPHTKPALDRSGFIMVVTQPHQHSSKAQDANLANLPG